LKKLGKILGCFVHRASGEVNTQARHQIQKCDSQNELTKERQILSQPH